MAGGTYLELEERERLAALKAEGLSPRAIARALGRAASTVSRELRRNALPRGCCRAGGPDAAGGGLVSRAAPSPNGARSTTGPRASRRAGTPGTGRVTC